MRYEGEGNDVASWFGRVTDINLVSSTNLNQVSVGRYALLSGVFMSYYSMVIDMDNKGAYLFSTHSKEAMATQLYTTLPVDLIALIPSSVHHHAAFFVENIKLPDALD